MVAKFGKIIFLNEARKNDIGTETEISSWGFFKSHKLETLFRERHRLREIRHISVALVLVIAVVLAFAPLDKYVVGPGPAFRALLNGRIALATLAGVLLIACRRRNRSAAALDRLLFLYGICGVPFMIGLGAVMPAANFAGYLLTEIYVLSIIYFLAPLPWLHKAVLGTLYTAADAYLVRSRRLDLSPVLLSSTVAAYLVTNFIGLLMSRHLSLSKREQFGVEFELESALARVKTLHGILPICAHCKKVRKDNGIWEPVEVYVRDRTDADFSHGI
jgi:hypothetical protein